MATLSVTFPDAVVPRIQAAFGHWSWPDSRNPGTGKQVWVNATTADVQLAFAAYAKSKVQSYETEIAALAKQDSVNSEVW